MLDRIDADHFRPLEGARLEVETPGGDTLALTVDGVTLKPQARMPDAPADRRIPFCVTLTAVEPTAFVDGACALTLPALGRVENVWVSRVAPLGRDPAGAYFQIIFN